MLETDFSMPKDLPKEFLLYDKVVKQLAVGKTGKVGSLTMILKKDSTTNKTIATELESKVPLQVQKIIHIDDSFPEMAYVYIMSPSGGILQGDRLKIDIKLESNAQAHVTTQAATKVYRMSRNYATQIVSLFVDDNCYLEFVPDQLIPYRNSRFYQCVKIHAHDNSTVIYTEIITAGRVASGECFEYDLLCLKTIATNHNSMIRFMDALLLQPKKQKFGHFMDSKPVFANMYILTKKVDVNVLSDTIHDILSKNSVIGSASVLPRNDGVFVRIIANNVEEIKNAIDTILSKIRNDVLNKPFTGTRKY